jgi:hypothetical protein
VRKIKKPTPANDSVNHSYVKAVSTEQIHALVKFLPILESIKPEDLERAVKSQEPATDSLEIGRYEYHPAVYEFMQACYENGFIQRTFNWPSWAKAATPYLNDAAFIDRARLTTCIKLIMASVRYQRFCDGHLGEVIKSGHITAILRRLKQLADARLENSSID